MNDSATESGSMLIAKLAPPASVTAASLFGLQVSQLVLWVTLIYTVLMIAHKLIAMWRDISKWLKEP
jgi:hypothetical protein